MKVAIYARYSTDKQKPVSIAVQNENTRTFIAKQGWTEVAAYADEAITGAVIKLRPGMTALLQAVDRGEIDLVLADELDRLSRSQSQTPMIFERFQFLGVRLHTIAEGEITRLHVGLKGTMNAEQLAATSRKPVTPSPNGFATARTLAASLTAMRWTSCQTSEATAYRAIARSSPSRPRRSSIFAKITPAAAPLKTSRSS